MFNDFMFPLLLFEQKNTKQPLSIFLISKQPSWLICQNIVELFSLVSCSLLRSGNASCVHEKDYIMSGK
ncbi:hypothetical protein D3Z38_01105 [Clostridiales bacterium]|nr:hypothetical protein [Clostridiales bacterium]